MRSTWACLLCIENFCNRTLGRSRNNNQAGGWYQGGLMQLATLLAVVYKHWAKVMMERGDSVNGSHKSPLHGANRRAMVIVIAVD